MCSMPLWLIYLGELVLCLMSCNKCWYGIRIFKVLFSVQKAMPNMLDSDLQLYQLLNFNLSLSEYMLRIVPKRLSSRSGQYLL
jgi:hypothetical protein